ARAATAQGSCTVLAVGSATARRLNTASHSGECASRVLASPSTDRWNLSLRLMTVVRLPDAACPLRRHPPVEVSTHVQTLAREAEWDDDDRHGSPETDAAGPAPAHTCLETDPLGRADTVAPCA